MPFGKADPGPVPDFNAAADKTAQASQAATQAQTVANRPNINTGFGTQSWSQGPGGQWTLNQGFNPTLQGMLGNLQNQAVQANASPLDFGSFGKLGTGDDARNQAISAAYGQATSRLDPQFQRQQEQTSSQLAAQGLTPGSQAYRSAMDQLGIQKNDAYNQAMNSAIGQGTQAGSAVFGQNMAARQQAIQEALTGRQMPMQQLGMMQQMQNGMPQFNAAGMAQTPNYLAAQEAQYGAAQQNAQMQNQMMGNLLGAYGQFGAAGIGAAALSDERLKKGIIRYEREAYPGVKLASWEWKASPGERHFGVIAQDLEKVAPQYVTTDHRGIKWVDYSFLNGAKNV